MNDAQIATITRQAHENSKRIAVFHQCSKGNHFGSYADQNIQCPVCGVTEEMPKPRYIYDEWTPLSELPGNLVNKDTYPELHETWTPQSVGGRS